jgi:hypothetical protein
MIAGWRFGSFLMVFLFFSAAVSSQRGESGTNTVNWSLDLEASLSCARSPSRKQVGK